ncbi:glycosyltransferase [candidate division KSB1 bacterium]|nr:glycosyltransferase [candidate division KSB1 bacterium]
MRILYVAGREESYSRTRIVYKALKAQGFDVFGCFPLNKSFAHYPRLIWRAAHLARKCDVIIVGFYGQIILPFIKLLTWKPILFDMYIATFDTMVNDRRAAGARSFRARFYKWSDMLSCRLSTKLVMETNDHIRDFANKFRVDQAKFQRIFLAVDDSHIYPRQTERKTAAFLVHFHGEYAPFHGVKYILQAAHMLRQEDVHFQIIGKGITYEEDQQLARQLGLTNVSFIDPVPYEELADYMARADVCLGIFGDNERMLRVLTNKVIESIAMGKPLITGRNAPVQELLTHGQSAYLVERANPQALAQAILTLKNDPDVRQRIARGGFEVFKEHCTLEKLGQGFATILRNMNLNG